MIALLAASLASAQTPSQLPRIALVDTGAAPADMAEGRHPYWGALLVELRRLGYVEGRDVTVERWSGAGAGSATAYKELARKVVASKPRIVVVRARSALSPIAAETKTIPIVAVASIPAELRASLARPGGNVTGIHNSFDAQVLYSKQVEVLHSVLKPGARVAYLGTKVVWDGAVGEAARKGATAANLVLHPVLLSPVSKPALRRAFAEMAQARVDGVLISPASEFFPYRESIAELAAARKLPSLGGSRPYAEAGILLSYGADFESLWRSAAHYVDKILKGMDPGAIPIEQPTKVDLVINLETAKAIGITVPQSMLIRADKVIE